MANILQRVLWRTKLKNNLKAIHNWVVFMKKSLLVVANQFKEQFESNSQLSVGAFASKPVVANQVKEQFESNSQHRPMCVRMERSCGEPI